ncbi:hypothetical protein HPT25_14050 [Bacillus sp. BRMEA1]|uniref:hypothetical protein n=1 Tax=Neobacillus endophyticus TaxID=2738405 RepID=UPI001C25EBE8|nr:hypothetical protein [Neobacillus endophyticus]NRD78485.1 hypothetical protein [Neobacillus endophyticus]
MTKTKWILILVSLMDLILIIMHLTNYFILFLMPTGYIIPLAINIIVLFVIGFRSSRFYKFWTIIGLMIGIPILIIQGFMVWVMDNSYTKTASHFSHQSLIIEYRHFTFGETTYFYNFYKTSFGFIGKRLNDQSISIIIHRTENPSGVEAKSVLGLGKEEWISDDIVRFSTREGMKDVYLKPSHSSMSSRDVQNKTEKKEENIKTLRYSETIADIKAFIVKMENKEDGQTLTVNGNRLEVRYDKASGQSWIDVINDNDEGAIPRQQCSRIVSNEESGYYMLEECTHQWEYPLYPMADNN